ncbi:hypothetical protein ACHHYP_08828 [Achlya hypogyna]|uniref:Carbohydrate-binding protein n=1 Tax=Achlya hypogyna TaxID=1202772 RepID=A0A1V9YP19_ACHHY|nr:hypothetical protein ACHHYP_08828 [Achlya hypogyna]
MAHEMCCADGHMYVLLDYLGHMQHCCYNADGSSYPGVTCNATSAPVTPVITTAVPTSSPPPITVNPGTTAAPSACTSVSVAGDATYCIDGPICSGSGIVPAGTKCPIQGDVASADCHTYLKSYVSTTSTCALPINSTCQKIPSGAWGCVLSA